MPLFIEDKKVEKISGPVSMNMLYPSSTYLKEFPYAPIFILFGDIHFGNEKYCEKVDKDRKPVENNYSVFDINFLSLLSDAVKNKGNEEEKEKKETDDIIDFYLEGGDFHVKTIEKSRSWPPDTPMHKLWQLFNGCYYNERISYRTPHPTCSKIKNIRWQSADIRFFDKRTLSLFNIFHKTGNSISKTYNLFQKLFKAQKERILADAILKEDVKREIIGNPLIKKQLDKIIIPKCKKKILEYFDSYIEKFFANYKDDVIDEINNFNFLVREYLSSKIYSYRFQEIIIEIENTDDEIMENYFKFLLLKDALLLDLYTLARSYKIMCKNANIHPNSRYKDPPKPLIVICYFGLRHIYTMLKFLLDDDKYLQSITEDNDMKYILDELDKEIDIIPNRCIRILTRTKLDKQINDLRESRKKYEAEIPLI
jgi:hypothetical protein